jgi:streptogramin lyase
MQADAKVWVLTAALSLSGCGAQGSTAEPQRKTGSSAATPPDGTPWNPTPSRTGNAGSGGQSGKAGAGPSSAGSAGRSGGLGGAGGTGSTSADTGGAGSTNANAVGPGSSAGSKAVAGGAGANSETTNECPSLTRARLPNGACVDRVTEFSVATNPSNIVTGSDGRIWFDDGSANQIVQLDDQGRVLQKIGCDPGADSRELVAGRGDAILWYTDWHAKTVTRLSKNMERTPFALGFSPAGLSLGTGDQIWLTEVNRAVYRLNPGELTMAHWDASPNSAIIVGPDKNFWFPEGVRIGRLAASGEKQDFPITDSFADDLCAGPDDALWFTDGSLHQIGRMAVDGTLSRTYDLPPNSRPFQIIVGPDGALWFTERSAEKIGRLSVKGELTHYPVPTANSLPYALTVGPDRNIWFTERFSGKIGRLIPDSVK